MISKEKFVPLIGILALACLFYLSNQYVVIKETSIESNKAETIGKVFRIDIARGYTHAYFYYNYDGKRFEAWKSIEGLGDNYVNRFYTVNVSTENPSYSEIFLDEEVLDSIAIINAGFRKEK